MPQTVTLMHKQVRVTFAPEDLKPDVPFSEQIRDAFNSCRTHFKAIGWGELSGSDLDQLTKFAVANLSPDDVSQGFSIDFPYPPRGRSALVRY